MKIVYQTDAEGFFTGPVQADPSPLEPGVWLIPGGCVDVEPPALSEGQRAQWANGAWVVIDPPPEPEPEPEPTPEELLAAERAQMRCSPLQGRLALAAAGLLPQVETAVAAADQTTQVAWEYAVEWKRTSPMISTMAAAVGMTETQIDDLFRSAMQIEV